MKKIIFLLSILYFNFCYGQSSWQNISTKGMGYVDGLIIHPTTNAKYIRTDVGGIFHFNEATQNWSNLTDKLSNMYQTGMNSVEAFAIDKNTSSANQVIYALCGDGDKSYLLKTINNGNSWAVNQGWNSNLRVYGNGDWRCSGEKIAVDPNNSNVVYCGTRYDGLYKTTDAAQQWNPINSFIPRGGNGKLGRNGGISFVVFDPNSTTTLNNQTVTKNIYIGLIDGGVYRSNDGGNAWCYLAGGMDTSKYNPVRAVFNNNRLIVANIIDKAEDFDGEVWQFTPDANSCAGGLWENKTPGLSVNFGCPVWGKYMYNAIAVKPNDPNTVYVFSRAGTPRKIFCTNNFNAAQPTWKIVTFDKVDGYSSCLTSYQKSEFQTPASWVGTNSVDGGYDWVGDAAFDINNPNQIFLTSGNGVMKMEDINTNPVIISSNNVMKDLEILCVNDMISPPAPNDVPLVTASMDVFGILYNDFTTANMQRIDNIPIGAAISMDYSFNNPNFIVTVGQSYGNERLTINRELKSKDGGRTWRPFYNGVNSCSDIPWGGNIAVSSTDTSNIIWIPNQVDSLSDCATPTRTFPRYTKNGGLTWNSCNGFDYSYNNFPFTQKSIFGIGKMLESDKVNGNKFYLYVMPSTTFVPQIWRTVDGGANWSRVTVPNNVLPLTGSGSLKANPYVEGDLWFAPFNRYILSTSTNPADKKLYHSTNSGETWQTINTMDEVYCYGFGMKVNGSNNTQLIVYGKKAGVESVFVSNDLGVSFTDIGTQNIPKGIITNIVGDMKVAGRIFAATGCRGVWVLNSLNTLPNVINSFTGSRNNGNNILNYQVTNSVVSTTIEYSADGNNFVLLATFNNLNETYNHNTNNAISYYRLKLKLQNGNFKYSNIIKLMTGNNNSTIVYPNPAKDLITLTIQEAKLLGTTAAIFDTRGSKVSEFLIKGYSSAIDVSKLVTGVYYIRLSDLTKIKLIKQ
jgi:xyloglucan-specific exo-beta-1,4-glucanase